MGVPVKAGKKGRYIGIRCQYPESKLAAGPSTNTLPYSIAFEKALYMVEEELGANNQV